MQVARPNELVKSSPVGWFLLIKETFKSICFTLTYIELNILNIYHPIYIFRSIGLKNIRVGIYIDVLG